MADHLRDELTRLLDVYDARRRVDLDREQKIRTTRRTFSRRSPSCGAR